MFLSTGIGEYLLENDVYLFADKGYSHPNLITPIDAENDGEELMVFKQYSYRSHIETIFSEVKNWLIAKHQFRKSIFTQKMILMIIYNLVALKMTKKPLREIEWFYAIEQENI